MKTTTTNNNSTSLVDIIGAIAVISFIILASTNAFAQRQHNMQKTNDDVTIESPAPVESFVAFRYDNFENYNDAPAVVPTKETLENDRINRKMENYSAPLKHKIGLPSLEDVKENILEEIINGTGLVQSDTNELIMPVIAHLMKDDTKTTACLHLIKDDTWC